MVITSTEQMIIEALNEEPVPALFLLDDSRVQLQLSDPTELLNSAVGPLTAYVWSEEDCEFSTYFLPDLPSILVSEIPAILRKNQGVA